MFHKNAELGDRHPIHNFEYANAAARLAAVGFVDGDLNKIALQLDDGSYWRLSATVPTWVTFGRNGADGAAGAAGAQGLAGPAGADGAQGPAGPAGADGSGSGDMLLGTAQTVTAAKTFNDAMLLLRNVANTFSSWFTNANTAARTYTLPNKSGTVAMTSDITGTNSGTNTGDQTSIVGITGTIAQFNTACTDADFATGGGTATGSNTGDQTLGGLGAEAAANKNASNGYAGLTLFKIAMKNVAGTFTSFFTNTNSAARTYTLPDKDGTVAMTSDITGTNSGTNTGDETAATVKTKYGTTALATGILKNTTTTGTPTIATGADLPAMSATEGGAVPTPPNNTTTFLRGDGTFAAPTASGSGDVAVQNFRLTLTTGVPITTSDVTGATTIYCTPYNGSQIGLYDGSVWNIRTSAQFSIALGTLTSGKPYDVFCYDNAGTPTLEMLIWTSDTARATALAYQDGVLVKSGAATRRYLGTFYTTSTTQTEDSVKNRYLWNYYNRASRTMKVSDAAASWTYSTATIRQANGNAANQVNFVIGVADSLVAAELGTQVQHSAGGNYTAAGIGLDSTTATANGDSAYSIFTHGAGYFFTHKASYYAVVPVGKHSFVWQENGNAVATATWYGGVNAALYGLISN